MAQTFVQPREVRAITFTHEYSFTMRRLAWWTLVITAVAAAAYALVGFPPSFDTYYQKMYFHAIGIGIAALAAYLVLDVFDLEAYEPALDFPIRYRAFISVAFAGLGGLLFLNRDVFLALPDIGILLMTIAFILAFDVTAALLVELIILPRKKAATYDSRSRNLLDYVGRLVPAKAADRSAYAGLGAGYWLTVISLASVFVAEIIGFANLWVRVFGVSIFGGLTSWLGLDATGFEGATLDPHSHMIAIAILGIIVAVAAVRIGIFNTESRIRRMTAQAGGWIALVGVILTTLVLGAVAFLNFAPPTVFASPDGVNGMAGDDLIMTIVFLGAMVVVAAILASRAAWRQALRLTVLGTLVASFAITVLEGLYIEMHHDQFGVGLAKASNDASFVAAHPMAGLFVMILLGLSLLLVEFYGVPGRARLATIGLAAAGIIAAVVGTTMWTFVDPSQTGLAFGLYVAALVLSVASVLSSGFAVRSARTEAFDRTTP